MQRRMTNTNEHQHQGWMHLRHPKATVVGSTLAAGVVVAAASVLGAGAVAFAASVGVAVVVGGWGGGRFGRHRERTRLPREATRRRRTIRILRITRTLRRRKLRGPSSTVRPAVSHHVHAEPIRRPA